jgi:hypothetical protein
MEDLDSPITEMDDMMTGTNFSYTAEDGKQGSSWIAISHSHRLSILEFISKASPDALEACFCALAAPNQKYFRSTRWF